MVRKKIPQESPFLCLHCLFLSALSHSLGENIFFLSKSLTNKEKDKENVSTEKWGEKEGGKKREREMRWGRGDENKGEAGRVTSKTVSHACRS